MSINYFAQATNFESAMSALSASILASDGRDWSRLNVAYSHLRSNAQTFGEALQKYPEQSFAQKFSLCNRQKFSGRKIKEGF